jgi:hypothetical protein
MNLKGVIAAAASVFLTANSAFADIVVCPPDEALRRIEDYNRNLRAELARKSAASHHPVPLGRKTFTASCE